MSQTTGRDGIIAPVLCIVMLAGYAQASQSLIEPEQALKRQVGGYEIQDRHFIQALMELAGRFGFPLAIEWKQSSHHQKLTRSWHGVQVSAIIDDVLSFEPEYAWKVSNRVVHVYHKKLFGDKRNFLNLGVDSFSHQGGVSTISRDLYQFVRTTVRPQEGPPLMGNPGDGPSGPGVPEFSFSVEHVTLREALDKLLLLDEHYRIWLVTYAESGTLTTPGFFDVAQVVPMPRSEQPLWNLPSWTDAPIFLMSRPRQ
jgi:hypothetical protein